LEVGRGVDLVDEAERAGLLGREARVAVGEPERLLRPDEARQGPRGGPVGRETYIRVSICKLRPVARDGDVAREREAEPAARGRAVDRRDEGLLGARE